MNYPTFAEQSAAYREGAQVYNEGKSWRENPYPRGSALAEPWLLGFNDRKMQVTAIRQERARLAGQMATPEKSES